MVRRIIGVDGESVDLHEVSDAKLVELHDRHLPDHTPRDVAGFTTKGHSLKKLEQEMAARFYEQEQSD